jgi:glutathione S-transferase
MTAAITLYFAPLSCSLATRISLYEAGAAAQFAQVDLKTKRVLETDADYFEVTPMGQVPALSVEKYGVLSENTAVLQYVAERFPEAQLAPRTADERARMQQWLGFIGTELHKAVFVPLLDAKASKEVHEYSRSKAKQRLDVLQAHLKGREFVLDRFSIADAYLTTVLNWSSVTGVDLKQWPAISDYHQRMHKRPSIAKAFSEEMAMYKEEQAKHAQA